MIFSSHASKNKNTLIHINIMFAKYESPKDFMA